MRAAVALLAALALAGCGSGSEAVVVPEGDADRGRELISGYGCGTCHRIGGIADADGTVGPDLRDFSAERYIAGKLPRTPEDSIRWIMSPQAIEPETIMPDLGVTEEEAADIVAYLYSQ